MHTTQTLKSSDFAFYLNGNSSSIQEVFPNFNYRDRIGIVVHTSGGSIGASTLYMAAITNFYNYFRSKLGNENEKLRIYPDYYVFHVGNKKHMDHFWMDIYPSHKEVIVKGDSNELLNAINDRGITRLLIEQAPKKSKDYTSEAYNSAVYRIDTAVMFSRSSSPYNFTGQVTGPPIIEKYIKDSLNRTDDLDESMYSIFRPSSLIDENGKIVESFRHLTMEEALRMLASPFKNPSQI